MTSATETAGLSAAEITLLMIHYQQAGTSTPLACHQQLAAATGGTAVSGGTDLSDDIISQIQAAAAEVDEVLLVVSGAGCQTPAGLNISFNPAKPARVRAVHGSRGHRLPGDDHGAHAARELLVHRDGGRGRNTACHAANQRNGDAGLTRRRTRTPSTTSTASARPFATRSGTRRRASWSASTSRAP